MSQCSSHELQRETEGLWKYYFVEHNVYKHRLDDNMRPVWNEIFKIMTRLQFKINYAFTIRLFSLYIRTCFKFSKTKTWHEMLNCALVVFILGKFHVHVPRFIFTTTKNAFSKISSLLNDKRLTHLFSIYITNHYLNK